MKFAYVFAFVAAATAVSAETNAQRMARGLPPMAPARRATPASRARRSSPSGTPSQCNTGSIQCCNSTYDAKSTEASGLLGLLGLDLGSITGLVGVGCSSTTIVGAGAGSDCNQEPVCCSDNSYNGLINIGCSPININL
ncbi:fungal hydrophobin [Leucogyrophana mollusca]|uniref:Fungal hydrophobin n=1 Tax=Leucogyrophana mollusca TaxID=85980 RepID=A0ACB8BQZ9_9AGAM|nr:fungal hydrophobin [Leucogyrophana mollusca]